MIDCMSHFHNQFGEEFDDQAELKPLMKISKSHGLSIWNLHAKAYQASNVYWEASWVH